MSGRERHWPRHREAHGVVSRDDVRREALSFVRLTPPHG